MKHWIIFMVLLAVASCKVFKRCELVKELRKLGAEKRHLDNWVCIARYESNYNTSAVNRQSGDHGIFQINERWWCNTDNKRDKGCHISCKKLEDNNIADDFKCAKKIYKERKRAQGDGFRAWVAYNTHCSKGRSKGYAANCP